MIRYSSACSLCLSWTCIAFSKLHRISVHWYLFTFSCQMTCHGANDSHWICEIMSIINAVGTCAQVLEREWVGIRCQEPENEHVCFVEGAIADKAVLWGVTYPVSQRIRYARYRLYHITFEKVCECVYCILVFVAWIHKTAATGQWVMKVGTDTNNLYSNKTLHTHKNGMLLETWLEEGVQLWGYKPSHWTELFIQECFH